MNSPPPGAPGSAARDLALEALGSGFSAAFLVCGIAAAVAALLTAVGMIGVRSQHTHARAEAEAASSSSERDGAPEPAAR